MFTRILVSVTLYCLSHALWAAPLLTLDNQQEYRDVVPYIELLEDKTQQLTIDQVTAADYAAQFKAHPFAGVPNFGRTASAWWVKLRIQANVHHDWFLLLDQTINGSVQLFLQPSDVKTSIQVLTKHRLPTYHLKPVAGEIVTVYLRVTNGNGLLSLPLKIMNAERFIEYSNESSMLFSMLFAGMMVLAFYNLLLFFSLREKANLYLTFFILTTALLSLQDSHVFYTLTWFYTSSHVYHLMSVMLMLVSGFLYWRGVNQGASRVVDFLVFFVPRVMLLLLPFALLLVELEKWFFIAILLFSGLLFVFGGLAAWHGHQPTRQVIFPLTIYMVGIAPYVWMQAEWIAYHVTYVYLAQSSALLMVLLLSFAQGEQTRMLREEKKRIAAMNQAKDEFLATISHELRTPMHAVMGLNTLMHKTPLNAEQQDYLVKLESSSQHMLDLIDDILDMVSMVHAPVVLEEKVFNLNDLLLRLEQMFTVLADRKGLVLAIQRESANTLVLIGDEKRLFQVLANLLSNAIKYTDRGKVELSVNKILENNIAQLNFIVADTGVGIPPAQQPYLFLPFYKMSSASCGVGLGLAISQKLLTSMGAVLKVDSQFGQGSVFSFTLHLPMQGSMSPVVIKGHQQPVTQMVKTIDASIANGLQAVKTLLVDDDNLNLFIGKRLLEDQGAIVTTANSGENALQCIQQQSFDLVFMDINMPQMNGYEVTQKIRALPQCDDLPIIALTAHALDSVREQAIAAGMNDFLVKPFTVNALYRVAVHWLSGNHQ